MTTTKHWTEESVDDFVHRITFDFTTQIEQAIDSHAELARSLGVTNGRVSQILKSQSISLKNIVKSARAIGRKVALVLYDDNDPGNSNGPVNSQVFSTCWERAGRPADFFDLEATTCPVGEVWLSAMYTPWPQDQRPFYVVNASDISWASLGGVSLSFGRPSHNDGAAMLPDYASNNATTSNTIQ